MRAHHQPLGREMPAAQPVKMSERLRVHQRGKDEGGRVHRGRLGDARASGQPVGGRRGGPGVLVDAMRALKRFGRGGDAEGAGVGIEGERRPRHREGDDRDHGDHRQQPDAPQRAERRGAGEDDHGAARDHLPRPVRALRDTVDLVVLLVPPQEGEPRSRRHDGEPHQGTATRGRRRRCDGLLVGAVVLSLTSLAGITPVRISTAPVVLGGLGTTPWWVPAVVIGAVATGLAYVAGILAINMVGPTLASFLGFSEVIASGVVAWLMLGEALTPVQIVGAVAIVAGVIAVKRGEQRGTAGAPRPGAPANPHDGARTPPARTA